MPGRDRGTERLTGRAGEGTPMLQVELRDAVGEQQTRFYDSPVMAITGYAQSNGTPIIASTIATDHTGTSRMVVLFKNGATLTYIIDAQGSI